MGELYEDGAEHKRELDRLAWFLLLFCLAAGTTYLIPQAEALRPWVPAEPLPLAHLLESGSEVRLDTPGEITRFDMLEPLDASLAEPVLAEPAAPAPAEAPPSGSATQPLLPPKPLPHRPPAVAASIEQPEALEEFFEALAYAETGEPGRLVRVLHWGDSTIAADGITGTVRRRLQDRFGDGGPGFVPVHVDARWQIRPGILRTQKGAWETLNVTFGGAESPRYGLGGNVSTAAPESVVRATLGGMHQRGKRQDLHRFDVFLQRRPGGGTLQIVPQGHRGRVIPTGSEAVRDRFVELNAQQGAPVLWLKTRGDGPVTVYGVALETRGPGVTWETFGVAGASIASVIRHQGRSHMRGQVERRDPDLIVYQTGGNELSYPSLIKGGGEGYEASYLKALAKLRAGKPEAPCLLIAPLDQARRVRGRVVSKENLTKMLAVQRRAAKEAGCAFWDARAVMGGEGGVARWVQARPRLASTDLIHLTGRGLDLMGDSLADAVLSSYDQWRQAHPGIGWEPEDVDDDQSAPPLVQAPWERWLPEGPLTDEPPAQGAG